MLLNHILKNLIIDSNGEIPLMPVFSNHKEFQSGAVFFAIKGTQFDGHKVLSTLINPAGVIIEDKSSLPKDFKTPYILVSSTRKAWDLTHHYLNQNPSEKLICIGITGTNGKTTTSLMVEDMLNHQNMLTGVIGTIDHHLKNKIWKTEHTSPGSQEFYQRLYEFIHLGAKALSVEVSSHALDQDRMYSTEFNGAVFTNLTRDHLDYHGTLENYFQAKEKLFSDLLEKSKKKLKFAVVNADDPYSSQIRVSKEIRKITYGIQSGDLKGHIVSSDFSGQSLKITYKEFSWSCKLPMVGNYNCYNFLAAFAVGLGLNLDMNSVARRFEVFHGVKGRMQKLPSSQVHVFIDYAHTPDALLKSIQTLNNLKKSSKVITVFGCGGDRDKGKRPEMGRIACELSDQVVITSDNPRTEYPQHIIDDILKGCSNFKNFNVEIDRKKAIHKAIQMAAPGDAVLIAGKGHENYQIIGKTSYHFSDEEVAKEILN